MTEQRKRMTRPLPASDILAAALKGKPAEKRLNEGKLWLVWDEAVGEQIASKARPAAFRNGILSVTVVSAPWMQQLSFLKATIIEKLNALLGELLVQDIYFKAGNLHQEAPTRSPAPAQRNLTPEEEQFIAEQASDIEDPELQNAITSLMKKHLGQVID